MTTEPAALHLLLEAVAIGPLLLISGLLIPANCANRNGRRLAFIASRLTLGFFGVACCAALTGFTNGPFALNIAGGGAVRFDLYFDRLAAVMLLLVSFLGAVVTRYSRNYLAGESQQGRFVQWLAATIGSVLLLLVSGNFAMFTLAWMATSLCLHQLLIFYPDRPAAVLAAHKKFLISRLGDACLIGALALTWRCFGTWDFAQMFSRAEALRVTGVDASGCMNWCSVLLVAGAMLKSAQFPFHSWLPDTMETPTPVSALMHAGIINAGGFLVIRLHPIVTLSPAAMSALALVGAFTALFASLVMLTHASVKRSLAFSTVAQMGFMMLECGLGAFGLAVLHLVSHSLYKAHAFLSSGSIVSLAKSAWVPTEKPKAHWGTLVASFATAFALALGASWLFGIDYRRDPGLLVLSCTFAMALAYALWNMWSQSLNWRMAVFGIGFGAGVVGIYFTLHRGFDHLLGVPAWINSQLDSWPGMVVTAILLALFLVVLVIQTELPEQANSPFFQALYVHARNGFYINTLANRLVANLLPVKLPKSDL